jgi:hypothetical protein
MKTGSNGPIPTDVSVQTISPVEASSLLEGTLYEQQRNLRGWYVHALAEEMRRGEFHLPPAITIGVLPDGRRLLLDGQHRLHALVEADATLTMPVITGHVTSKTAAFQLYSNMDCGLARGAHDLAPELKHELGAATTREVTAAWAAVGLIGGHFTLASRYEARSRDWRLALLRAFRSDLGHALGYIRAGDQETRRLLLRTPILAVAVLTVHWCPEQAETFWQSTAENDGLRRGDPRRALLDYLRGRPASSLRLNLEARYAAGVWNAAQAKRTFGKMTGKASVYPVDIDGTPYRSAIRDGVPAQLVPTLDEFTKHKVLPLVSGHGAQRAATPEQPNFVTALTGVSTASAGA